MGASLAAHRGVPPERGLVGECPPARIAHEWLLPRVDPMVALERVELRELLATLVTTVGPLPWEGRDGGHESYRLLWAAWRPELPWGGRHGHEQPTVQEPQGSVASPTAFQS